MGKIAPTDPHGQLDEHSGDFLRIYLVDLFSGNKLIIDKSEPYVDCIPISDHEGVAFFDDHLFRVELNFERQIMEVDWQHPEPLPHSDRVLIDHQSGAIGFFGYDENDMVSAAILNLRAKTDAEKWIRFKMAVKPRKIHIHGDSVFILPRQGADGTHNPIQRYSIKTKTLSDVEIPGIQKVIRRMSFVEYRISEFWLNGKFYINVGKLDFFIVDAVRRRSHAICAVMPQLDSRLRFGNIVPSALGLIGIATTMDEPGLRERPFEAFLIPVGNPPPLQLLTHFRLLNSGRRFGNLPPNDVVSPLFGQNRYREGAESGDQKDRPKRKKRISRFFKWSFWFGK